MKIVTIVGLGLIGGSIAKDLRKADPSLTFIGVDKNVENARQALELNLVDSVLPIKEAVAASDLVFLAIPVTAIRQLLPTLLDIIPPQAVIIDLGSTKSQLCKAVEEHQNRQQFVAAHPIAGTENSGPAAALEGLYQGKMNIICEREKSSDDAIEKALQVFDTLGMNTIFMQPEDHDKQVAYISHLSHVSSFLLGLTVLDAEKDEKNIFTLAGSGFASTVRLAKSSPDMWAPIFEQNSQFLSQALSEYIFYLQRFQQYLQSNDQEKLYDMMKQANKIRPVLDGITQAAEAPAK
ncbi:prephenate dehydrogenase [Pontibacter sp. 13R65]|uniref:prephenate dehydrogenase n=1 Tax=Pontibacter sp. 13R65 TaxID=3127458 RepID=UPI00301D91BD